MAQTRETHAKLPGVSAQARIEGRGQRQARFGDGRAIMVHVSQAEGQRGFVTSASMSRKKAHALADSPEPRLCDQIAERLSGAERVASTIEQRADSF